MEAEQLWSLFSAWGQSGGRCTLQPQLWSGSSEAGP